MSSSLEVRQFLMQQDIGGPAVPSQRNGDSGQGRVNEDQVRRARLAVASIADDAEDCKQLLDMLGLLAEDDGVPPVMR